MLAVHKGQRIKAALFALGCYVALRLQLELMQATGYPDGVFHYLDSDPYERGVVGYGILVALYLLLCYISPNTKGVVFLAASLSIYFTAVMIMTGILIL